MSLHLIFRFPIRARRHSAARPDLADRDNDRRAATTAVPDDSFALDASTLTPAPPRAIGARYASLFDESLSSMTEHADRG